MNEISKLNLRNSQIRSRLAEIAATDGDLEPTITAEVKTLTLELQSNETKLSALYAAEANKAPDDTGEGREIDELAKRVSLTDAAFALTADREFDVAMRELQAAEKVQANAIPWAVFAADAPPAQMDFADVNTSAPSDRGVNLRSAVSRVFAEGVANFLGVTFTNQAMGGDLLLPIVTAGGTAAQKAEFAAEDSATFTLGTETATAQRLTLNYRTSIEALKRMPSMEDAMRGDLRMAMTDRVDDVVMTLAKTTGQHSAGLFANTNIATPSNETTPSNGMDFNQIMGQLPDTSDYAPMISDFRFVVSHALYTYMSRQYDGNSAQTAIDVIRRNGSGIRGSSKTPALASKNENGIASRGRGLMGAACFCSFGAPMMVVDAVTDANAGAVRLTLNLLYDFVLLRAANFTRFKVKTS